MANLPARIGLATSILIACSGGVVCAADIPVKAAPVLPAFYNWSGIYVGAHAGYGMGMKDWTNSFFDFDVKGHLVGGQIGINQQIGNFVVGIEVDASWANLKGSQTIVDGGLPVIGVPVTRAGSSKIDRLATVAGRIGLAQDRWLVYFKGGAGWLHESHTFNSLAIFPIFGGPPLIASAAATGSETRFGPMLGFGAEYVLWGNLSFKSEYNYFYLPNGTPRIVGTQTVFGLTTPLTIDARIQQSFHLVKFGLNYRFGPDSPPSIAPARPAPGYNWTGFYVGAQAAYGFGRKEWEVGRDGRFNVSGALAGGVTGTNVQVGAFVFGVESEWMWSGLKGSTRFVTPFILGDTQTTGLATRMDWLSLSGVRAGFVAADRWLLYFKGGVALAHEAHALTLLATTLNSDIVTNTANGTALHTGYLAGIGVEYAFLGNWSAKLEYNFIDFLPQNVRGVGSQVITAGVVTIATASTQRNTIDQNMHLVKFGVNYHFTPIVDAVSAKF